MGEQAIWNFTKQGLVIDDGMNMIYVCFHLKHVVTAFIENITLLCLLQILPEKYFYYRRFDQESNHTTDCVICMTAIDLTRHSNDCMVYHQDSVFFPPPFLLLSLHLSRTSNCKIFDR